MKKLHLNTIARKLGVSVVLIGCCLSLLISFVLYPQIYTVLRENAIANVRQMSNQAAMGIDKAIEQYELYSRFINADEYLYQLLEEYQESDDEVCREKIHTALSGYLNFFPNISSMLVLLDSGESFTEIGGYIRSPIITESDWFSEYQINQYSRHFSSLYNSQGEIVDSHDENSYLFVAYPYQNKSIKGDLIFLLPFSIIQDAVKTFSDNEMDVILFGRNNMPIYNQANGTETAIHVSDVRDIIVQSGAEKIVLSENKDGVDIIAKTQLGGWKLVVNVSRQYIIGYFQSTLYLLYFMQIIVIIVFVISLLILITRRLKPLRHFSRQMEQVSEDNIQVEIDIRSGDEIEDLAETFNRMIHRIQQYIQEKIEHDRREKRMEYALLVAQVDPHFIYKTLNIITYLAEEKENEKLVDVNCSLIDILQDRLRISKIDVFDNVETEIKIIEAYIAIQKVRYGDCIQFEKKIGQGVLEREIPKNIIQPLIENAIFHGILLNVDKDMNYLGGTVLLEVDHGEEGAIIHVIDNGPGISQDVIQKYFIDDMVPAKEKGKHIGIQNIRKRLSYLYGDDYTFRVTSSDGIGTKITMILGKRRNRDEGN